jgi:hypothetical protein
VPNLSPGWGGDEATKAILIAELFASLRSF